MQLTFARLRRLNDLKFLSDARSKFADDLQNIAKTPSSFVWHPFRISSSRVRADDRCPSTIGRQTHGRTSTTICFSLLTLKKNHNVAHPLCDGQQPLVLSSSCVSVNGQWLKNFCWLPGGCFGDMWWICGPLHWGQRRNGLSVRRCKLDSDPWALNLSGILTFGSRWWFF